MDPISAGLSAGASVFSSLFGASSAKKAAKKQMDFQERMDNTKHQREVADLKAAGLNPMLSAGAANSAPSGAMDMSGQILSQLGSQAVHSGKAAVEAKKTSAETENVATMNNLLDAQVDKTKADAATSTSQQFLNTMLSQKAKAEIGLANANSALATTTATKMGADPKFILGDALKGLGFSGSNTAKSIKNTLSDLF